MYNWSYYSQKSVVVCTNLTLCHDSLPLRFLPPLLLFAGGSFLECEKMRLSLQISPPLLLAHQEHPIKLHQAFSVEFGCLRSYHDAKNVSRFFLSIRVIKLANFLLYTASGETCRFYQSGGTCRLSLNSKNLFKDGNVCALNMYYILEVIGLATLSVGDIL